MNPTVRRSRSVLAATGLAVAAVTAGTTAALAGGTTSHNEQVVLVNETGAQPAIESAINGTAQVSSHEGRYVVFSTAAALVPSDTNELDDVYLRDTADGISVLVSARNGTPGNDYSVEPTVSADGRFVAFTTWATNLTQDTNGPTLDVVVKDMQTDRIRLVSVDSKERQRARNSFFPVISGNGRHVSFQTFGRFGPRDEDRREDVYVRDLADGVTRQGSLHPGGRDIRGPVLNGDLTDDGSTVVFGNANMLWARNVATGRTIRFWQEPDSPPCQPFPSGSAGRPAISGDGRFAAFASCATDLPGEDGAFTDVYRIRISTGEISRVGKAGNDYSFLPSLSRTGRYVGFGSDASNLVTGDDEGLPDAFVADTREGTVVRASQATDGSGGDSWSATTAVAITGDGHSLAYTSYADNLVPGDASDVEEVFLWRR